MKKILRLLLYSGHLNMFAYSLFGPIYAIFVLKVGGSTYHAGASWSLYMLVSGIAMLYFSRIEDNHKLYKNMIIISYFILAFGSLGFIMVKDPMQLYLIQTINAIGIGMLNPAWRTMYTKHEDVEKEAQEWAIYEGVDKILIAIAALLGGVFVTYYSFNLLFIIIFLLQISAALISLKLLKV
jgi:predicted MFS family arabinose efflux permease